MSAVIGVLAGLHDSSVHYGYPLYETIRLNEGRGCGVREDIAMLREEGLL